MTVLEIVSGPPGTAGELWKDKVIDEFILDRDADAHRELKSLGFF